MKPWHAVVILALVAVATGAIAHEAIPGATAADWATNPVEAAKKAGATAKELEGLGWGTWAAIFTGALTVLGFAKKYAPLISKLIPVYGPMIEGVANLAWLITATPEQKAADKAAAITHQAAGEIAPILAAVRALPPGTLPEHVQQLLGVPIVSAAIDRVITESAKATP